MAFGDWEFFESAGVTASHDTSTPLIGTGSLLVTVPAAASNRGLSGNVTDASGIPRGHIRGKLRAIINVATFAAGYKFGFYCMASQKDLRTAGSAYFCLVRSRPLSSADSRLEIWKATSGGLSGIVLITGTANNPGGINETLNFALEFEWQADVLNLGGVHLVIRGALGTSFTGLPTLVDYTDVTSPLTSTVSEGICGSWIASSSEGSTQRMDNTEIYSQSLV